VELRTPRGQESGPTPGSFRRRTLVLPLYAPVSPFLVLYPRPPTTARGNFEAALEKLRPRQAALSPDPACRQPEWETDWRPVQIPTQDNTIASLSPFSERDGHHETRFPFIRRCAGTPRWGELALRGGNSKPPTPDPVRKNPLPSRWCAFPAGNGRALRASCHPFTAAVASARSRPAPPQLKPENMGYAGRVMNLECPFHFS
jgi:hypothetical protein